MKIEISGQPQEMATGPPLFQAWPKVVKQPARIEMIEKEMAKLEKPLQLPAQLLLVAEFGEPFGRRRPSVARRSARGSLPLHTSLRWFRVRVGKV